MEKILNTLENFGKNYEKTLKKPWKYYGKTLENFGKNMKKPWNPMEKLWKKP